MTMDAEQMMSDMMRRHMPGIKTQAQYDAVMAALDATKEVLNAILAQDFPRRVKAVEALSLSFYVTEKATELTHKLEEVPEAATSAASEAFKATPAQFHEHEVQTTLMSQLADITSSDALNAWYSHTKPDRDKIVSQALRNELLDAVRAKRNSLFGS